MPLLPDPKRIAAITLSAALGGTLVAQAPSAWQTTVLPQPVDVQSLKGQGKLVTYDLDTELRVYSATSRRWHTAAKSATATVRVFNDCVVILDGFSCTAFGSHTNEFRTISLTGPTLLENSGNSKNDSIVLLFDNQQLHAFSAFTGRWVTRAVSGSTGVSVRRHVAVFADGTTIGGMSAFEGEWHVRATNAVASSLDADGSCAFAFVGNDVHAFSAHHENWRTEAAPAGASFVRGDDWALWTNPTSVLGYSGLRGSFADSPVGATTVAGQTDLYALLTIPTGLLAWSAFTGSFVTIHNQPAAIEFGDAVALLRDVSGVRGYAPLHQAVVPLHRDATAAEAGTVVAVATDATGVSRVFDGQLPAWIEAPDSAVGSAPTVTTTTVALPTSSDCFAYAAGKGQWVALGTPVQALAANVSSSPLIGYDANELYAFDTRSARWLRTPLPAGSSPAINIWRTSALAHANGESIAIGAQAGSWHRATTGTLQTMATNSEVGYVVGSDRISACGMVPRLLPFQQFPQFRRVQPISAELRLLAALPSGAIGVVALGEIAPPRTLPGLGTLQVDGGTAALLAVVPTASEPLPRLQLGRVPTALRGLRIGCQMAILAGDGTIHLDDLAAFEAW